MSILEVPDQMDPGVAYSIRKNERVAKEALRLIVRRNKKLDPEKAFEMVANTIGILCADLIRDSHEIAGTELSDAMQDLIVFHMDRTVEMLAEREGLVQ